MNSCKKYKILQFSEHLHDDFFRNRYEVGGAVVLAVCYDVRGTVDTLCQTHCELDAAPAAKTYGSAQLFNSWSSLQIQNTKVVHIVLSDHIAASHPVHYAQVPIRT